MKNKALVHLLGALIIGAGIIGLSTSSPALAADGDQSQNNVQKLQSINVISVTPLHETGIPKEQFPANVQSAGSKDLQKSHNADLGGYMNEHMGSVFINESQDNPLQPNVSYRGYTVSPLLGLPQGLAVYEDGVRLNEPFGDSVNFSLIPQSAISSVELVPGSDPVFGRNALGGALSIQTKSGLTDPGTAGEAYYGSFDRRYLQAQTGGHDANFNYFITGESFDEDGWRDYSPSRDRRIFGKLGWQDARTQLSLGITAANTDLVGNGADPVQLLDIDRSAIFTRPDETKDSLVMINLKGQHQVSDNVLLGGNLYFRRNNIDTRNGDDSDYGACSNPAEDGYMCTDDGDGDVVYDTHDNRVRATPTVEGGTNNTTSTNQDGYGTSAQLTFLNDLFGKQNQLVVGGAFDGSNVDYQSQTELAYLDATRLAVGSGTVDRNSLVNASINNLSYGLYFTDTWTPVKPLSFTVSGRYNRSRIDINDRNGDALDGDHTFSHFNPAAGVTYQFIPAFGVYARYSVSNRFPVASELTCADPTAPCRLPNDFVSDPALKQVIAKSTEVGARGHWKAVNWTLALFRAVNHNDIQFISAGQLQNTGYFRNVGETERRGVEMTLDGEIRKLHWFFDYTYLQARYLDPFTARSPNNPQADSDGDIHVRSGDRIPNIPLNQLKLGGDYAFNDAFDFGATLLYTSSQYLQGDESNQNKPYGGYTTVDLHTDYKLNRHVTLFARIDNVFDKEYASYGTFGDAGDVLGDGFDNPRFYSPGAPRAGWFGVRATF